MPIPILHRSGKFFCNYLTVNKLISYKNIFEVKIQLFFLRWKIQGLILFLTIKYGNLEIREF